MKKDESEVRTRGLPKMQQGTVVSNKMNKSVVVAVVTHKRHPQYGKYIRRTKRYMAHDETNQCNEGDQVMIVQTRPLSKSKRWRVQSIVERAV
ncbi:MAG: 30S ribosomal protein S17 [Bdellovibrionales bacterium]|nr:30S ribosomal protein S17 [Bdellovibrionales bacterium]